MIPKSILLRQYQNKHKKSYFMLNSIQLYKRVEMSENVTSVDAINSQNIVLKEIINGSWNAIGIIELDSKFKFINKAFSPVLGYSQDEILKMKLIDIVLEEHKEAFTQLLIDNQQNEYINKMTLGCVRKDQQKVYLEVVIHLMKNEKMFVINAHDVTADVDEKKLLDHFVIQFQIDSSGKFLKASDAFYRLLGYSLDQITNSDIQKLFHNSTNEKSLVNYYKSIKDGSHFSGELILKKSTNEPLYVDFTSKPYRNKYGDIIGFTAAMIDISSEKKLQKQEEFLEEKLIDEEEKLTIMSETMRTVAHEWRQPLNTISLEAQSLAFDLDFDDEVNKENIKEKLEGISKSTEKLSNVIESFQAITELKESKKQRHIKDIVIESLQISELYGYEYIQENHKDTKSFRTYPKELANALSTILTNAKEFVNKLENPCIKIETYEQNHKIVCNISNNGGHINEDIIDKIFTPYFSTKTEKNGVGLSLYTCKIIVELHLKGTIEVRNEENNFVNFKLTFPIGALDE